MTNNGSPSPRMLVDIQLTTSRPGTHVCVSLVQSQYVGWFDLDVIDNLTSPRSSFIDKVSLFVHEPK